MAFEIPVCDKRTGEREFKDMAGAHIPVAIAQIFDRPTRPWAQSLNPAYADVNARQVWDKAAGAVVVSGEKPEAAADAAIKEIQDIFSQYQIPA